MVLAPGMLEAFGLIMVRTSALVLGSPLLGTGATFSGYKIGLIGVLSLVFYVAFGMPALPGLAPVDYAILVLREVLVGLTLAFALHAVLMAVRVGSELVGHEMAFTMARQVDPSTGTRVPLIGHLYELLFLLALLSVNGHHWIIRALFESYERAPVGELRLDADVPVIIVEQFSQLFAAGLTFAAPVVVMLILISLVIGLITRAVPQINVLEFGFNLRIAGGLTAMYLFAPALAPAMESLLDRLMRGLAIGLDAVGA